MAEFTNHVISKSNNQFSVLCIIWYTPPPPPPQSRHCYRRSETGVLRHYPNPFLLETDGSFASDGRLRSPGLENLCPRRRHFIILLAKLFIFVVVVVVVVFVFVVVVFAQEIIITIVKLFDRFKQRYKFSYCSIKKKKEAFKNWQREGTDQLKEVYKEKGSE